MRGALLLVTIGTGENMYKEINNRKKTDNGKIPEKQYAEPPRHVAQAYVVHSSEYNSDYILLHFNEQVKSSPKPPAIDHKINNLLLKFFKYFHK